MNDLALASLGRQVYEQSEEVIKGLLPGPQVPCPLIHRFGPGMYIREAHYPAGSLIVGHVHKLPHLNIFVRGRLKMLGEDGSVTEMVAPMTFVGKPGRKFAYITEDVIWQNVWATDKTDIDEIEADCYDMPEFWFENLKQLENKSAVQMLPSARKIDVVPIPAEWVKCVVRKTPCGSRGVFATIPIYAGEAIVPATVGGVQTVAGHFVRRSDAPNAAIQDGYLIALMDIEGCLGGGLGTEITVGKEQQ